MTLKHIVQNIAKRRFAQNDVAAVREYVKAYVSFLHYLYETKVQV